MLEHLVQVDHVEGGIGETQGEEVRHLETQVLQAQAPGALLRLGHDVGGASIPTTSPGATRRARSPVMVPGPQPRRAGADRDAAEGGVALEFSAVRQVWLRSTDSWCPCV